MDDKTPSRKSGERDVVIVGGGISGAALAFGLAGKGCKATVLDAPTRTNMASRTNVGLIWCQSKFLHLPEYARWGFMSSRLFPELVRELEDISGLHVPVNFTGGLIPVLGEDEFQKRADYIVKLREALGEYRGAVIERGELEKLPQNHLWAGGLRHGLVRRGRRHRPAGPAARPTGRRCPWAGGRICGNPGARREPPCGRLSRRHPQRGLFLPPPGAGRRSGKPALRPFRRAGSAGLSGQGPGAAGGAPAHGHAHSGAGGHPDLRRHGDHRLQA